MKYLIIFFCATLSHKIFTVKYFTQRLTTTVLTNTNRKALQNRSLKKLQILHQKEQENILPLIQNFYDSAQASNNAPLNNAYLLLQQRMQLPKIIPLFITQHFKNAQVIAAYQHNLGCVTLSQQQTKKNVTNNAFTYFAS